MKKWEPVFSRQEQGVVYLFSRYWQDMPAFTGKRTCNIQMRFPDASIKDITTGADEAIEFEYVLSSFKHVKRSDWKTLKAYDSLYIVYWEQDADESGLRRKIREHFAGDVVCNLPSVQATTEYDRRQRRLLVGHRRGDRASRSNWVGSSPNSSATALTHRFVAVSLQSCGRKLQVCQQTRSVLVEHHENHHAPR